MRLRYAFLVPAALMAGTLAAQADTNFVATIEPCQETGSPNPCGVSTASGSGTFVLNTAQTELTYNITFSGLTSTEAAAHFHNAPPGIAGGVVRGLQLGSPKIGVWTSTDAQPLTPALVSELLAGNIYVNIHSNNYPAGEIRGQLRMQPTPTLAGTWGRIKQMYR